MRRTESTRLVSLASFASLLALFADSSAQSFNVAQLEQAFADDTEMTIVNSVEQLPGEVQRVLGFQKRAIANLGEAWHTSTDVEVEDPARMPATQHIFSAVSERLFFVLVQRPHGGWSAHKQNVQLILGERSAEHYCTYTYRNLTIGSLRLDTFQSDFNRRDRAAKPTHSECEIQQRSM